ncbi:hypothetical protein Maq22A_c06595 [Methylobacterium aquaticum]|uniref:Uncharacterized protein n=1 Tax=Methylobacterium aquaticum TaxID=270351 RepID=A0A0C6EX27_9HYPH|nr:hypothetical protein Maq22A_c06595 [Methylobacterium aquaticum]
MDLMVARQSSDLVHANSCLRSLAQQAPRLIDESVRFGDVSEHAPIGRRAVIGLKGADDLGFEAAGSLIDESRQRLRPGGRGWFASEIVGEGKAKLVTASAALNELHAAHRTWSRSTRV